MNKLRSKKKNDWEKNRERIFFRIFIFLIGVYFVKLLKFIVFNITKKVEIAEENAK